MKKYILLIFLVLCAFRFSGCQTIKDLHTPPASLDQMRLIMALDGDIKVGTISTTNLNQDLKFLVFGEGTYVARGFGSCDGHFDGSFDGDLTWVSVPLQNFNAESVCTIQIEVKNNSADSNISGIVVLKQYDNPDIIPFQINGQAGIFTQQFSENPTRASISENKKLKIDTQVKEGTLKFRSECLDANGLQLTYETEIKDSQAVVNIATLYGSKPFNESCIFNAAINNNEGPKEMGAIHVHIYKKYGSWLPTPITYKNSFGKMCFEFKDPYTAGVIVNGKITDSKTKCVSIAKEYTVIGFTSGMRLFFGQFKDGQWRIQ